MSGTSPSPSVEPKIFICYRRDDSQGSTGRLYDQLSAHFGPNRIFMDVDAIRPGEDFVQAIDEAVRSSGVFIAVIGKRWLGTGGKRSRAVDDPNDFVRMEVLAALERDIRVIPVLVDDADMPRTRDLPSPLAKLTRRNAIEVSHTHWKRDVAQLIKELEVTVGVAKKGPSLPGTPGTQSQRTFKTPFSSGLPADAPLGNLAATRSRLSWLDSPEYQKRQQEREAKADAELKRKAEARKRLPSFYQLRAWWISIFVTVVSCILAAFLAEWLFVWSVSLFGVKVPSLNSRWTVYLVTGLAWATAYSAVAANFYQDDPESGPGAFYLRGLLGGWSLFGETFEPIAGLLGSFPLSLIVGWSLARGLGHGINHFVPVNYSGIAYLGLAVYSIVVLGMYIIGALDVRDRFSWW